MVELGWRWEALQVINKMEKVRQSNNVAWMDLLRIAVQYAPPDELRRIATAIDGNDREITDLWQSLREQMPASQ